MVQSDPNRWVWWYKPTETPQRGLYSALVPARLGDDRETVHGIFAFFRSVGRVMFMGRAVLECREDGVGSIRFAPGELINCPRCLAVDTPIRVNQEVATLETLDPQPPVLT